MSGANVPASRPYSRAFESFVESDDDIVGLLAYALYKQDIREAWREGRDSLTPEQRNPGTTEIKAFRGYAERAIEQVIEQATDEASPQWLEAGREEGRLADKAEILQVVRARTSFGAALVAGIVAWLLSIGITILVVYAAPGWVRNLTDRIDQSTPITPPR